MCPCFCGAGINKQSPTPSPFCCPVRKKQACLHAISIACLNAIPFLILCSRTHFLTECEQNPFHMWHRYMVNHSCPIPWHNSIKSKKTSWLWISHIMYLGTNFQSSPNKRTPGSPSALEAKGNHGVSGGNSLGLLRLVNVSVCCAFHPWSHGPRNVTLWLHRSGELLRGCGSDKLRLASRMPGLMPLLRMRLIFSMFSKLWFSLFFVFKYVNSKINVICLERRYSIQKKFFVNDPHTDGSREAAERQQKKIFSNS